MGSRKRKTLGSLLMVFFVLVPSFLIAAAGIWLGLQPNDLCLGKSGVAIYFFVCGLAIIIILCCGICWSGHPSIVLAGFCGAMVLLLITIVVSLIALRDTMGKSSFEREINGTGTWKDVKGCIYRSDKVCAQFQLLFAQDTESTFLRRRYSRTQSGCCKPPKECKFKYRGPSFWMKPENGTYSNSDCYKWDNDLTKLCYDCQACKLGFARSLKKQRTIASAVVLIASLVIVFFLVCLVVVQHIANA